MGKAIGIDLGTTNTVVAVLLDGRPQVLEDDKGYRVLPSVVTVDEFGGKVVGHAARNRILTHPDRTVYAIKRIIGRRFDSDQVTEARQRVGYPIAPAPDGGSLVTLGEEKLSPAEVSGLILQTAREMAERALGTTVDEAVITVPAYFNHQQRAATLEAARLAGLRCERLINEPTAAALAYGYRREVERTLVIYDLGGGTFDVSVLHLAGGVYEILATRGDTFLGGEDFDYRLVDHLADQFQTQSGIDLRRDRMSLQRIKDAAERAKCELSFTDRTTVLVPRITPDRSLEAAISRLALEGLVEDLVQRSLEVTRKAVSDAGLQIADIDDVIIVGGQTRMPRVREALAGLFGKEASRGVHPEEVVAIGAAVHASSITEAVGAPHHVLIDVTPFDLGIDVAGGLFQTVVSRNSHVPTSDTRIFATTRDNQDSVRITVRQGDSRFADENEFLGEFVMDGLTPAPRMETKVEVTFRIDSSGMLHVAAAEPGTGEARRITVRNYAEVAGAKGAVPAQLDGDVATPSAAGAAPSTRTIEAPAAVGQPVGAQAAVAGAAGPKVGFLSALLGRGRKPAAAPSPGPAKAPSTAASGAASGTASDAAAPTRTSSPPAAGPVADGSGGRISLPTLQPLDEVGSDELLALEPLPDATPSVAQVAEDELSEGHLYEADLSPAELSEADLFEGELSESELSGEDVFGLGPPSSVSPASDAAGRASEPAAVGMAGASRDSWRDEGDHFEMPADDEDEDEHVPVGLAGGYEAAESDPFFSMADSSTPELSLPELPAAPTAAATAAAASAAAGRASPTIAPALDEEAFDLESEEVLLGLGEEAFTDMGEEAFADLGEEVLADLGDDAFAEAAGDLFAEDEPTRNTAADHLDQLDLDESRAAEPVTSDLFEFITPQGLPAPPPMPDDLDEDEPLFLPPPALRGEDHDRDARVAGRSSRGIPAADDSVDRTDDALFSLPPALSSRPPVGQNDDERTEIFARSASAGARPEASATKRRRRKPARLKLAYRSVDAMVQEYRENLRRGGCFVKTTKPLPVGRECVIEVRAPGMEEPLCLGGVVTWSSVGLSTLPAGQDPGMGIEYRLDDLRRGEIERVMAGLDL